MLKGQCLQYHKKPAKVPKSVPATNAELQYRVANTQKNKLYKDC